MPILFLLLFHFVFLTWIPGNMLHVIVMKSHKNAKHKWIVTVFFLFFLIFGIENLFRFITIIRRPRDVNLFRVNKMQRFMEFSFQCDSFQFYSIHFRSVGLFLFLKHLILQIPFLPTGSASSEGFQLAFLHFKRFSWRRYLIHNNVFIDLKIYIFKRL